MISINLDNIVILKIHDFDYCWNINGIDKSEALNFNKKMLIWPKKEEYDKIKKIISTYKSGKDTWLYWTWFALKLKKKKKEFHRYKDPAFKTMGIWITY